MRIGELAVRSGVSVRSLRYYEEQELLDSTRSANGQRHYGEAAVDRVQYIQMAYAMGMTSRAIRELLPSIRTGIATDESVALLRAERDRVRKQMAELAATEAKLDEILELSADPSNPCSHMAERADVA